MTELADQQFENAYRVLVEDVEPFEAVADARLHRQLIPNQVVTENYTSPFLQKMSSSKALSSDHR